MDGMTLVARIAKLFGSEGELVVNLYDTFPGEIPYEEPLYAVVDGLAVPLFIESFRGKGKNGAIVRFADLHTPQRASEFTGKELFIKAAVNRRPNVDIYGGDEIFLDELAGFHAVIREQGGIPVEGEIAEFIDSEMNPLFRVATARGEILIPAAVEFIETADPGSRTVEFILPEGLLGLYI